MAIRTMACCGQERLVKDGYAHCPDCGRDQPYVVETASIDLEWAKVKVKVADVVAQLQEQAE